MPTKKRITAPGAIAPIMARGIEGKAIFVDAADRNRFLYQLTQSLQKTGYVCYGWALMHNHYHLIVRCSERPMDELVRAINSRYAKYFNANTNGADTCFKTGINRYLPRTSIILKS